MVTVVILSLDVPKRLFKDLDNQVFRDFEVLVANEKPIHNALNLALKRAGGSIFVRIDDDVELPPWWLKSLISPFSDPLVAGVTGPTYIPPELRKNRDSIRWAENPHWFLRWLYDNDPYAPAKIYKCGNVSYGSNFFEHLSSRTINVSEIDHLEGTNWAMRTDLIRKVGGFDSKFDGVSEWIDTDVEFKIKKLGYKFFFKRKAYLWHMIQPTSPHFDNRFDGTGRIKNFLRFHWRHGRWRFLNIKFYIYLIIWSVYFLWVRFGRLKKVILI